MKIERVKKTKAFLDILANGKKWQGKLFSLHCKQDDGQKRPCIGSIITKRRAPKATQRNYIKRIIYAFFHTHKHSLKPGSASVIRLIRDVRGIKKRSLAEKVRLELSELSVRAGIMK